MTQIHSSAVVHKDAQLSNGVIIGPNCVIESGVSIGTGTTLGANVVVGRNVRIGENNQLFPNCVVGSSPQVLGLGSGELGGLLIGDNNIIREQVTVHLSMYPGKFTKIGNDNLLMVGVHIGHDCILEDKIIMSNYVQISGHCKVETGVWLSGMVLLHQFVTIGKWCYAAGLAGINRDVPPFLIISGHYPLRVRGVNKRGLKRAGLTRQQQQRIFEIYKRLYRNSKYSLLDRANAIANEEGLDEHVRAMLEAILKSGKHRFGRYLENFRH